MANDPSSFHRSTSGDHRPAQPSTLRNSHRPSSMHLTEADLADAEPSPSDPDPSSPTESTPLVGDGPRRPSTIHPAHGGVCNHGTFSPTAETPAEYLWTGDSDASSSIEGASGTKIPIIDNAISHIVGHDNWKKRFARAMRTRKMGRSNQLAEQAGVHHTSLMYLGPRPLCLRMHVTQSDLAQVPVLLRPVPHLDTAVQAVPRQGGSGVGSNHGVLLPPHGPLVRR